MTPFDLIGIGVGPFNLSLASLLEKTPETRSLFLERKPRFDWHPELMFSDSTMQTTYLKDLVTPVDPTSPYSFLNYLVAHDLFYAFINTQRSTITRREFEQYCSWVSGKLRDRLQFETAVESIRFEGDLFRIQTSRGEYSSHNICVATGLTPRVPECARELIGPQVFHAKSAQMKDLQLEGKTVLIVGGGQTGIEIFRNAIQHKWGRANEVRIITRRKSLEPLDESAFTNEYFTPDYVDQFWKLSQEKKNRIVASQKLASDGNTPYYLAELYNELYRLKHVENDPRDLRILAARKLTRLSRVGSRIGVTLENCFYDTQEELTADVVILCTGFQSAIPQCLEPLLPRIKFDAEGRFTNKRSYSLEWDGPDRNRIYALNYSRHNHGIMDPQTSLMAWRSAVVINDLTGREVYRTKQQHSNFVDYRTIQPS